MSSEQAKLNESRLNKLSYLRSEQKAWKSISTLSGSEIVEQFGSDIYQAFARTDVSTIRVLICAHNEKDDLPLSLWALSRSNIPIKPIIIDSSSTDDTPQIAQALGADVVRVSEPGLGLALEEGFKYFEEHFPPGGRFLQIDADTFPGQNWAGSMLKKMGN